MSVPRFMDGTLVAGARPPAPRPKQKRKPGKPGPNSRLLRDEEPEGRSTQLTPALREQIARLVAAGAPPQFAAGHLRVAPGTLEHWRHLARRAIEAWGHEGALATRYREMVLLCDDIWQAISSVMVMVTNTSFVAATRDARAARAWLSQVDPQSWAPTFELHGDAPAPAAALGPAAGSTGASPIRVFMPAETPLLPASSSPTVIEAPVARARSAPRLEIVEEEAPESGPSAIAAAE